MAQVTETTVPKVSQLATSIKRQLGKLGSGWVEGEVQEAKIHGGHCYLTLADEDTQLRGIIWRGRLQRIGKPPEPGSLIQVHYERVDFYTPKGTLSLLIDQVRLTGLGELLRRRAETLKRLKLDGLTDPSRKRPLPRFPRRIGVITGQNSNAWADTNKAIWDRFRPIDLVLAPASVEGVRAVGSIVDALGRLQGEPEVDVIILTRGGAAGVRELVPFDDEGLCRAIAASTIPVVTAVGHTPDRPNCDHVAAKFADVPGRAAELVVPSSAELSNDFDAWDSHLNRIPGQLRALQGEIDQALAPVKPARILQQRNLALDQVAERLATTAERHFGERRRLLDQAKNKLNALPTQLPRIETLDLELQRLERAFEQFLNERLSSLDQARVRLNSMPRELRSKVKDYGRAFERQLGQAKTAALRRLARLRGDLDERTQQLGRGSQRSAKTIRGDVERLLELLKAKDPRQRGWAMVTDNQGRMIGRAASLTEDQSVEAHFVDGQARLQVDEVDLEKGEAHE